MTEEIFICGTITYSEEKINDNIQRKSYSERVFVPLSRIKYFTAGRIYFLDSKDVYEDYLCLNDISVVKNEDLHKNVILTRCSKKK